MGTPDGDIPEMTKSDFGRAKSLLEAMPEVVKALKRGPGRPRSAAPKERISLRLDPKVVAAYRATGSGWQRRIADVLALGAPRIASKRSRKAKPAAERRSTG
jgi:uncharacterized protein (DUF4415 family)